MGIVASFCAKHWDDIIIIIIKIGNYIIEKVKAHNEDEKRKCINYCNRNNYSYTYKSC